MGSSKMFHATPSGINTHPTSANGGLSAALKSTGYQGRSAGNAAGKDVAAAKGLMSMAPLAPTKGNSASNAPGPKKV